MSNFSSLVMVTDDGQEIDLANTVKSVFIVESQGDSGNDHPFLVSSGSLSFTVSFSISGKQFDAVSGWFDWMERRETQRRWLARMMKVGVN